MSASQKSRRPGRPGPCADHEYKDFEMLEHPHQVPAKGLANALAKAP